LTNCIIIFTLIEINKLKEEKQMKINKIFFLPLTVSFSLYGLYQAEPDRQSIDWRLAFQQGLSLEREFTALKTADQTSIIPCPVIQSMSCIGDFKRYISTADTTNKNDLLLVVVRYNTPLLTQLLIAHGADVNVTNSDGYTPLHWTASSDYVALAQLLLAKGANVNARDNFGNTPLHFAVFNGHDSIVQLLINHGTDINATNSIGNTPLHFAVFNGHDSVVQLLINHGADVNVTNSDGHTPLHTAVLRGHVSGVQLLLANGADANATDCNSDTPYHLVTLKNHDSIVHLLIANGADVIRRSKRRKNK